MCWVGSSAIDSLRGRASSRALSCAAVLCCVLLLASAANAQLTTPLHMGQGTSIVDEFGGNLEGAWNAPGDLVQVLWASNSVIHPPATDGTPHPDNPIVTDGVTGIGALSAIGLVDEGIFAHALTDPRPGNNSKIFCRAFNAPTLGDSSFYGDSQIFTVDGNEVFHVQIGGTTNALDTDDDDGDGLNNSWEKSYDSDPDDPDSDGDGAGDGDEVRAGTDLLDSNSVFIIVKMLSVLGNDVELTWDSVTNKRYQVEYADRDLMKDPTYTNVSAVITGVTAEASATITNGIKLGYGHFRIRLVED